MRVVLSLMILLLVLASPADAADGQDAHGAVNSYILTATESQHSESEVHEVESTSDVEYSLELACQRGEGIAGPDFYGCGQGVCGNQGELFNVWAFYPNGTNEIVDLRCLEPSQVPAAATVTGDAVLRAFKRIPVPASEVVVQPPGGETLVNLDTVFSTDAESFTRTIGLLGHRVELDITASEFRWVTGDGTVQVTDWAGRTWHRGAALNELITHRYQDAVNSLRPRVDTTWSARYRVDGGPWRDVPGTVTITGEPYDLAVRSASPHLTG